MISRELEIYAIGAISSADEVTTPEFISLEGASQDSSNVSLNIETLDNETAGVY